MPSILRTLRQPCRVWIHPGNFRSIVLVGRQVCAAGLLINWAHILWCQSSCLQSTCNLSLEVGMTIFFQYKMYPLKCIQESKDHMRHFNLPREDSPVLRGVAPTPVALANLKGTAMIVGLESELCKCSLPWCILTHPVVRADFLVVGGIAAALALVAAAVVARPTFVAPEISISDCRIM